MLDENKGHARIRGQMPQKSGEGLQPAGRSADGDYRKQRISLLPFAGF